MSSTKNKPVYWAHQRGLDSEKLVQKFYEKKGYTLLAQRVITPFAEVDLIFQTPEGHALMVEVKTTNIADFQPHRISWKQKARLVRALQYLTSKLENLVEVHWAFVTKEGKVTIIEDISG
ncbi:YraN family protein [Bdellovibrio bacteriovorus]|uniref:YraN family protein n=1 Tax=Bdellovibrio bacteriovorus TaxID=959 RepID=UPI000A81723C|nr:YraN family protein [Bdellovibrio bacteriovorus]